jgi:SAM-dependent methyltransferase
VGVELLPRDGLVKTGPVDEAEWVYRPFLGSIARLRFRMIVRLLGGRSYGRVLEIGYGSGVFLPELSRHCAELHGIDPHALPAEVTQALDRNGTTVSLISGRAEAMPYPADYFDAVVAVSALEFVEDMEQVCLEVKRVLRAEGRFFFVTPGSSPVLDLGLKLLTGNDAKKDFGGRREIVLPVTRRHFLFERALSSPPLIGRAAPLYRAVRARPI